jgi:TetR/AcrR family transcriptional regulator, regulator of biofilm formation and stress response
MSMAASARPTAGKRRLDPDRRSRIIDAALDVIAENGVAGTSHRRVAAEADVPLGSMTYHFASMDELLREAFTRFAEDTSADFRSRFAAAGTQAQARAAVVDLITSPAGSSPRDLVLTHELYTLAARVPAFRQITRDWMARDRAAFEAHFDPATARLLNALIEGLTLHQALDTRPGDPALAADAVDRIIDHHPQTAGPNEG